MYCRNCGHQLEDNASFCPNCGCRTGNPTGYGAGNYQAGADRNSAFNGYQTNEPNGANQSFAKPVSKYSRGLAMIFVVLLGYLGVHRFYVGKVGTGILWLLTIGCFGIGSLVDLIMIACGSFTDANGNVLTNWEIK